MPRIYRDSDADLGVLKGKKIAIIGYGSQGRHQALNLRDSGLDVIVAEVEGTPAWNDAKRDGFEPTDASTASRDSDMIILLVPDELHGKVYNEQIAPHIRGKTLGVSHAYSVFYGIVKPPRECDVVMVAPKGPGPLVRELFLKGSGIPACVAVAQDYSKNALSKALAWAKGIGSTRVGVIETTFREEVETDHFGEICVLCGGCVELIKAGFETLVEAGYQPEIAFFECCNELKLIVDLIYQGGIEYMWSCVSNTAEYGGRKYGKEIIGEDVKKRMRKMLKKIQKGEYAKELIKEQEKGMPTLEELRRKQKDHLIEKVGDEMRKLR